MTTSSVPGSPVRASDHPPPRPSTSGRRLPGGLTGVPARLAVAAVLGALVLGGCSSGGSTSESLEAPVPASAGRDSSGLVDGAEGAGGADDAAAAEPGRAAGVTGAGTTGTDSGTVLEEKVISTGSVSLRADDVADLRFDVQGIADDAGGTVAEESADTSRKGEMLRSRMVLRVPTAEFDAAMDALERAGRLVSSQRGSDVVTAEYRDVQARVRAQEKSLARVEVLFARAEDIRDIMAIEAELSRRQAELDALKGQLRYLDDQTSMSTITVRLERTPEKAPPDEEDGAGGFLAGFDAGWAALGGVAVAVATLAGALLPFAVVLGVLGAPVWLLLRRRRTGSVAEPTPAE